MVRILAVAPGGIGAELELEAGDAVLSVNGRPVRDLIDFELLTRGEELLVEVLKTGGDLWDLEIEKEADAPLGLELEHPEPTQCGNNCLFCFVHQLPPGMRRTLYVKDEDYRFSFLYGSYVTLTNLSEEAIARIVDQRLSPLYVSVHATEEQLRERLLGRLAPPILELLARLAGNGISFHTQVVVCPGINDGPALDRTVEDLARLGPGVLSLALVPVGLTGYRQRLPQLRTPSADEAKALLLAVTRWQERFLGERGTRFVFAADELYQKAGAAFPPLEEYEDLPQLENGVGMIPLFREEAREALAEAGPVKGQAVSTFTGLSAYPEVLRFAQELSKKTTVPIHLHPVRNDFFGGEVTVTGLLCGRDVIEQLRGRPLGQVLLIPDVLLKEGEELFLDDLTPLDLERELGVKVRIIASSPFGLMEGVENQGNPEPW